MARSIDDVTVTPAPSEPRRVSNSQIHAVLFGVAVLFSLNYVFAKIALRGFEPLALAWVRVLGSALLLVVVTPLLTRGAPGGSLRATPRQIIVFSILGVVINQLLFISGLARTTAHEAAILITTIPVFTTAIALGLRRETAAGWKIMGILVAGVGALMVAGAGAAEADGAIAGNLLILLNCASYSAYLVLTRPLMQRADALVVVRSLFVAGTALMLPFCLWSLMEQRWEAIPTASWIALAAIIAGPTVLAYVLNAWALKHTASSMVAAYTYFQPLLASVLAFFLLQERLTRADVVGGALIFAGVYLSSRKVRVAAVPGSSPPR